MKYLMFKITDGMPTIPFDTQEGFEVVPLLEEMIPEQIIERILMPNRVTLEAPIAPAPKLLPPEIPKEDTEARNAEARRRVPWVDENPEETEKRKGIMTEKEVMSGSRVTAVDEEK